MGTQAPPHCKGHSSPHFSAHHALKDYNASNEDSVTKQLNSYNHRAHSRTANLHLCPPVEFRSYNAYEP